MAIVAAPAAAMVSAKLRIFRENKNNGEWGGMGNGGAKNAAGRKGPAAGRLNVFMLSGENAYLTSTFDTLPARRTM